jgi:hypothetical protein
MCEETISEAWEIISDFSDPRYLNGKHCIPNLLPKEMVMIAEDEGT